MSSRFHPKSRRLFPFYFSNITLRTELLTFGVTSAVFKIASEKIAGCRLILTTLMFMKLSVSWSHIPHLQATPLLGRASGRSAKTRHCSIKVTDDRRSDWVNMSVLLCEYDFPG